MAISPAEPFERSGQSMQFLANSPDRPPPEPAIRTRNSILSQLGDRDLRELASDLDLVGLDSKQVLSGVHAIPEHVYFLEGGIVSFTLELPTSGLVEFGVIGREGLSSYTALREGRLQPVASTVQVGGCDAYRIPAERLRHWVRRMPDLYDAIHDALYQLMGQLALTAASNARHGLPARMSRWLLLCDDRLDGDAIPLTHEFLARVLGAQRTSVTSTLHVLEGEGAIRSRRGLVRIIDRERLKRFAGEAYLERRASERTHKGRSNSLN